MLAIAWGVFLTIIKNPAVWEILAYVIKNNFEKDQAKKDQKKELYERAKAAIASRNPSGINSVLVELRDKKTGI